MRACLGAVLAAGLAGSALAGCNRDQGEGYLEIKTIPVSPQTPAALVLDAAKLDPVKKGQAILRAKVGPHKLRIEGTGRPARLAVRPAGQERPHHHGHHLGPRPPATLRVPEQREHGRAGQPYVCQLTRPPGAAGHRFLELSANASAPIPPATVWRKTRN
ncbi:MAG: hypothetical protein ACXWVB_11975 [Rhodoplanes sp.]